MFASHNYGGSRSLALATVVVLGSLLAVTGGAIVQSGQAASPPTVAVDDASVTEGHSQTVAVTLSKAPDGVSGFNVTVTADSNVALEAASVDEAWDYEATSVGPENRTVAIKGADVDDSVNPGATDVPIATLRFDATNAGDATVAITVNRLDDERGDAVHPGTVDGTLSVESASHRNDGGSDSDETENDESASDADSDGPESDAGSDSPESGDGGAAPPSDQEATERTTDDESTASGDQERTDKEVTTGTGPGPGVVGTLLAILTCGALWVRRSD